MGKNLAENFSAADRIYECGSDILGYDLRDLINNADESKLTDTQFAQPAIFAASLIALEAAKQSGVLGDAAHSAEGCACAGHSLGEYAALVACGVLDMQGGFTAIKERSRIMAKAGEKAPGGMTAVVGMESSEVEAVCNEVLQDGEYVCVANYNTPQQTVISGTIAGLEKAEAILESKQVRRLKVIRLKTSAAFHSKLMLEAAEQFKQQVQSVTLSLPSADFYSNVTGGKVSEITAIDLAKHIQSPVRFVEQLNAIKADGFDTFIEIGPGKVLSGLIKKTLSDVKIMNIEDTESLTKTKEALV
jgi:[acyl-carrier-protein] S-malonyltransferase